MVFSYYNKLSAANKRIYRASDAIHGIAVPRCEELHPLIPRLAQALEKEDRAEVEVICRELVSGMTERLNLPLVRVKVLIANQLLLFP